ncbi:MAG: hypothetical protein ACTHJ8_12740, partial [Mucilaginibacter sp.]
MQENPPFLRPGEAAGLPTFSPKIDLSDLETNQAPAIDAKVLTQKIKEQLLHDNEEYWSQENDVRGLFLIRPVKKWIDEARNEPVPKML